MEGKIEVKVQKGKEKKLVGTMVRGRKFEGYVIRKFPGRITIGIERVRKIRKYERYIKIKSKMHARLPKSLEQEINLGDYIQIQECRPLSKILHHIVTKKIRSKEK